MPRPKITYITTSCIICGKDFITTNTKRGRKKKTCSKTCSYKLGIINRLKHSYCCLCGKHTVFYKTITLNNFFIYCKDCLKYKYEKKCEICSSLFRTSRKSNRFCSHKCILTYNRNKLKEVICFNCGKEFTRPSFSIYTGKRIYCSRKCLNNTFSKEHPTRYGGTWSRWLRNIWNRDNGKCLLCNKKGEEVHHFIKVSTFENPNDAHYNENLGLFCKECHKKVENIDIQDLNDFHRRYSPNLHENEGRWQK